MTRPKGYVDSAYLQMAAQLVRQIKQRAYELMQLRPGDSVLDAGCGPATDTIPLAEIVGPTGRVVGVDFDAGMIAEADRRAREAGVGAWVEHRLADATTALPFPDDEFDAGHSERLFQHLLDPAYALGEMVRVTKPGGRIVVLDTDHGTKSWDTPETDIERRLARVAAERCLHNGYAGRQLYRLFKRERLAEVTVETLSIAFTDYALARQANFLDRVEQEALSAGIITLDELERWRESLEKADAEGVFFCSGTGVIVSGRK